jgi:hypothetical protein
MTFHINDGGTWKTPEVWLNDAGTWKRPEVWVNDAGTWKLVASPVSVSISPAFRDASGSTSSFTFPSCTVTVTGGTATAYSWGFLFPSGGTWSVASGQGLSSATARVTSVIDSASADFYCDVTVGGQVYRVSVPHSYFRAF